MPHITHPNITYVDENDTVIGAGPRSRAVEGGIVHRLVRVILTNSKGEVLLQKRANTVFLPGLWDQSVGGHVDEGEEYAEAAAREMREEVGADGVDLTEFERYYTESSGEQGKVLKRWNAIFAGRYDGEFTLDRLEVSEVRWIKPQELLKWINERPEDFTRGGAECFKKYFKATPKT